MRTALLLTLSLFSAACFFPEEGEPEPADGVELEEGGWRLHLEDVVADGSCEDMGVSVVPQVVFADLELRGHTGLFVDIDGVRLRGDRDEDSFFVQGTVEEDVSEPGHPGEDEPDYDYGDDDEEDTDTDEAGEDSGDGAPPPCETEEEPEPEVDGIFVTLDADVLDSETFEGLMEIDYSIYDLDCTIEIEVRGEFAGERPDDPVVVGVEEGGSSTEEAPEEEACG